MDLRHVNLQVLRAAPDDRLLLGGESVNRADDGVRAGARRRQRAGEGHVPRHESLDGALERLRDEADGLVAGAERVARVDGRGLDVADPRVASCRSLLTRFGGDGFRPFPDLDASLTTSLFFVFSAARRPSSNRIFLP